MTTIFPFVDPYYRLEHAVNNAITASSNAQWHRLDVAVELWWTVWNLHPECHTPALQSPLARCRLRAFLGAIFRALRQRERHSIQYLQVYVSASVELIARSYEITRFSHLFDLRQALQQAKTWFGDYTSGAKMCDTIAQLQQFTLLQGDEFIRRDGFDARNLLMIHREELKKSLVLPKRSRWHSAASYVRKASSTITSIRSELNAPSDLAIEASPNEANSPKPNPSIRKFKLKTLEEHRFATRFEEKNVTPSTWKKALRDARRKIQNCDRIQQADALYLLLEIAALRPKGCDLAKVFLNAGSIYLGFHHLDEAVKSFQQCLHVEPKNWKARYNHGVALARQKDFVNAKTELDHAISLCPPENAKQIQEILTAIETIQSRRNERAFKDTNKARAFTWQYLETLHLLSTRPKLPATAKQLDMARAIRSCPPTTPLLFDIAFGWNGPMATLLHEVHVNASMKGVVLDQELARHDTEGTGFVSLASYIALCQRVRGSLLPLATLKALQVIFPDDVVMFRLLIPNPETVAVIAEMKGDGGFFHAGLMWPLTKRRLVRSSASRSGGLWQWMELSITAWVREISQRNPLTLKAQNLLPRLFPRIEFMTPMDFVKNRVLTSERMPSLIHSDRGIVVFEFHAAIRKIQEEAAVVLQMYLRRLRLAKPKEVRAVAVQTRRLRAMALKLDAAEQVSLAQQQAITRSVIETLDTLVEEVVVSIRREQYARITPMDVTETPIRTENRQHLNA